MNILIRQNLNYIYYILLLVNKMEKVKKGIGYIPIILIIIFIGLYFVYQNGYYDKMTRDKIMLTNEQIEKFEQDVMDGKDVSLEKYMDNSKSYSTKVGNISLKVSNKIENTINKFVKFVFRKISRVVE